MRKTNRLFYIFFLILLLASCTIEGGNEQLIISEDESLGSSLDTALGASSESVAPEESLSSPVISLQVSSSLEATSSSSYGRVYFTVSIYQSYLIPDKGIYGNPRFDTSVMAEAKKPLYTTVEEMQELEYQCRESYHANGGAYSRVCFFTDETCQTYVNRNTIVDSNMNIYYYCIG